jgi:hypothetical protein
MPILLENPADASPFAAFMAFSEHLHIRHGRQHGIAPEALGESLLDFLVARGIDESPARDSLAADHLATGTLRLPAYLAGTTPRGSGAKDPNKHTRRQQRHGGAQ